MAFRTPLELKQGTPSDSTAVASSSVKSSECIQGQRRYRNGAVATGCKLMQQGFPPRSTSLLRWLQDKYCARSLIAASGCCPVQGSS